MGCDDRRRQRVGSRSRSQYTIDGCVHLQEGTGSEVTASRNYAIGEVNVSAANLIQGEARGEGGGGGQLQATRLLRLGRNRVRGGGRRLGGRHRRAGGFWENKWCVFMNICDAETSGIWHQNQTSLLEVKVESIKFINKVDQLHVWVQRSFQFRDLKLKKMFLDANKKLYQGSILTLAALVRRKTGEHPQTFTS